MSLIYSRFVNTNDKGCEAYLNNIATGLGVPPFQLRKFLSAMPFLSDPDEQFDLPNDVLLLEAAFVPRASQSIPLTAQKSGPSKLSSGLLKQFRQLHASPNAMSLQSITARYRTADFEDNSRTRAHFKLGIRKAVKLDIELRAVEEAGFDSIIDLGRWWADPGLAKIADKDPAAAFENAVPPVALFHQ